MSLRDQWKESGKDVGRAFKDLGKNVIRSVETGADALDDTQEQGSTVFNDGSWKKTGTLFGTAAINVGKSIVESAKEGLNKINNDEK